MRSPSSHATAQCECQLAPHIVSWRTCVDLSTLLVGRLSASFAARLPTKGFDQTQEACVAVSLPCARFSSSRRPCFALANRPQVLMVCPTTLGLSAVPWVHRFSTRLSWRSLQGRIFSDGLPAPSSTSSARLLLPAQTASHMKLSLGASDPRRCRTPWRNSSPRA